MMTVERLRAEGAITLHKAAGIVREISGQKPAISTLTRWHRKGSHGVRLDALQVGKRFYTTRQAIENFIEAGQPGRDPQSVLDAAASLPPGPAPGVRSRRTPEQGGRALEDAKSWLRQQGLRFLLVC
jgi:hypothetical protein